MREVTISEFNNINVYYSNEKVILPKDYSDEVEKHWNSLLQSGDNNFLSAIFKMDLLIDENQFRDMFSNYNEKLISKGETPEIKSLIFIQADRRSVNGFIDNDTREKDSNVIPTLIAATSGKKNFLKK